MANEGIFDMHYKKLDMGLNTSILVQFFDGVYCDAIRNQLYDIRNTDFFRY